MTDRAQAIEEAAEKLAWAAQSVVLTVHYRRGKAYLTTSSVAHYDALTTLRSALDEYRAALTPPPDPVRQDRTMSEPTPPSRPNPSKSEERDLLGERRAMAEKILVGSFAAEIQLKAAMIVIHRVARTMEGTPVKQREAMEQLMTFADGHPLPPELERLL